MLLALEREGIALAVDAFGAGFSSLSRLQAAPAHHIKLDRSLIAGVGTSGGAPRGGALVRATIDFAHALGREVTAEGVETAEQWHFLRASGCEKAQSYLLGRPASAEAITAGLLAASSVTGDPSPRWVTDRRSRHSRTRLALFASDIDRAVAGLTAGSPEIKSQ